VGALIINKFGKILLVKEKNTLKQLEDMWKIPTGLSEKGESIEQAVIREVKEETNLNIEFKGILSCREAHPYLFDTSDIFFICLCTCKEEQIIDIVKGGELKEFKWFTKEEIENILLNKKFSLFSANFFRTILNSLPNEIYNKTMSTGKEVKFLKSKFIFHYPKF
jgi:ADP-ribose pyrophosphatase YjhB (NUDIX family)